MDIKKDYIMKSVEEIEKIIEELGLDLDKVTINKNGSINYDGDVYISQKRLDEIPLQFNIVKGYFNCSHNKLINLEGAPKKCNTFKCSYNDLTSLEYAPQKCNNFYCYNVILYYFQQFL